MTYVMSDIHGCYDKYRHLLEQIHFSAKDTLYILGDLVDRGAQSMEVVLDVAERKNVICLRGNHDHLANLMLRRFGQGTYRKSDLPLLADFNLWLEDGGKQTYKDFRQQDAEHQQKILSYLNSLPIFEETEVGGQKYFLAHTVPGKEKLREMNTCKVPDFLFGEPEYEKEYFADTDIVTGHTPTGFIDADCKGKIWRGNNHIAMDCGAVFGNPMGCLCLETGEEFYAE